MTSNQALSRFHVTVIIPINKFVVNFIPRGSIKFWCSNTNLCTKFDVKSGLRLDMPNLKFTNISQTMRTHNIEIDSKYYISSKIQRQYLYHINSIKCPVGVTYSEDHSNLHLPALKDI